MHLVDAFKVKSNTFFFAFLMQMVQVSDHSLTKSVNLASAERL